MKEWQVFKHLESCTGPPEPSTNGHSSSTSSSSNFRKPSTNAPERLPAINYSMLKDNAFRKKLAEIGISNSGPRSLLEKRHKEWITLWNANCDAAKPKSRNQLLRDLDTWEKTQGGRAPTSGRMVQSAALIKDKDFDGKAWASTHDDSFRELIENARRSRGKPGSGEAKKEDGSEQQKPDNAHGPTQEVPSSSAEDGDVALEGDEIPLQEAIYRAYEPPGRRMNEAADSDMLAEDLLAAREEQERDHERAMFLHSMGAP